MSAPLPAGPTSTESVRAMLADADADVAGVVAAVNSLVRGWLRPAPDGEWDARHRHGAAMLAVRLYRRKDSPAGVLPFGAEGAAYVQRTDPDVALLLELGAYAPPRVG